MHYQDFYPTLITLSLLPSVFGQVELYQPCPLLGPFQPQPLINSSSDALQAVLGDLAKTFDDYVAKGDGKFGPISVNTTSFSVALFAGHKYLSDAGNPFFFEYHHTALETKQTADSTFAAGDLTQLFTTVAALSSEGDAVWSRSITEYLPELKQNDAPDPTQQVNWADVTLGALASHMAGVVPHSDACNILAPCPRGPFVEQLVKKPPLSLPDTTPLYSHAAFELLAKAIEVEHKAPFADILGQRILRPLRLSSTSLLSPNTTLFGDGLTQQAIKGEPASLGLATTLSNLSAFGRAILTETLLSSTQSRRWLKPVSDTSNLRNAVGRPWEIYHFGETSTDPIIDCYTKIGSVGRYSSYLGLVPDVGVGFAILAVETGDSSADLNVHADITLDALRGINALGYAQAEENIAGTYAQTSQTGLLKLQLTATDPGIAVTTLATNGKDWLSHIQKQAAISKREYVDMRLHPTNLERTNREGGRKHVFQAVIQDKSALVDAGSLTCISWMTIGNFQLHGQPIDRCVIEFDKHDVATGIEWPVLGAVYEKA